MSRPYFAKPAKRVTTAITTAARAIIARTAKARAEIDAAIRGVRLAGAAAQVGPKRKTARRQGPLKSQR